MRPQTTPSYSGTHCSHSDLEQSFDWPMGLLIESSKLSKFWPASHREATGVQSRVFHSMKLATARCAFSSCLVPPTAVAPNWATRTMDLTFDRVVVAGDRCAKERRTWGSLTNDLPVGNARKSTAISLIDTNKDTRPRATPIKRF